MDYSALKELLLKLSLFDLHRLNAIIYNELEHPDRIAEIRNSIAVGSQIEYMNYRTNSMVTAIVLQKNLKQLLVSKCDDGRDYWIRYHMVNLSGPIVKPVTNKLDKNTVSVGDIVGFEYEGQKIIGQVIKLNPKTAGILTNSNRKWKVSYGLLFPIIETELRESFTQLNDLLSEVPE
jgi:hypothetical protein